MLGKNGMRLSRQDARTITQIVDGYDSNAVTKLFGSQILGDSLERCAQLDLPAHELRLIKNLRNVIAHDYAGKGMIETFELCKSWTPILLKVVHRLENYIAGLPA